MVSRQHHGGHFKSSPGTHNGSYFPRQMTGDHAPSQPPQRPPLPSPSSFQRAGIAEGSVWGGQMFGRLAPDRGIRGDYGTGLEREGRDASDQFLDLSRADSGASDFTFGLERARVRVARLLSVL